MPSAACMFGTNHGESQEALVVENKQVAARILQPRFVVTTYRYRAVIGGEANEVIKDIRQNKYDFVYFEFPASRRHVPADSMHNIFAQLCLWRGHAQMRASLSCSSPPRARSGWSPSSRPSSRRGSCTNRGTARATSR